MQESSRAVNERKDTVLAARLISSSQRKFRYLCAASSMAAIASGLEARNREELWDE